MHVQWILKHLFQSDRLINYALLFVSYEKKTKILKIFLIACSINRRLYNYSSKQPSDFGNSTFEIFLIVQTNNMLSTFVSTTSKIYAGLYFKFQTCIVCDIHIFYWRMSLVSSFLKRCMAGVLYQWRHNLGRSSSVCSEKRNGRKARKIDTGVINFWRAVAGYNYISAEVGLA